MAGMANTALMAISRFPYAMARDGLLPQFLSLVLEKTNAPWISILIASVAMGFCIIFLPIMKIAKLGSSFKLLVYMLINTSCIVFRSRMDREHWYRPAFYSPYYPYTQIFGICAE